MDRNLSCDNEALPPLTMGRNIDENGTYTISFQVVLEKDKWPDEPDEMLSGERIFPLWSIKVRQVGDILKRKL